MPQSQLQQTSPSHLNKPRTDQVEYDFNFLDSKQKCEIKRGTPSVKGKLKENVNFWEHTIQANEFILNVIKEGYKIPFLSPPEPVKLKNNASALQHVKFVKSAISELLDSGCIVEQSSRPFCVNPLSVSVNKNGKERLILDLRHVNQYIEKQKIKFEGSKEALNYAKKGDVYDKI